MVTLGGFNFILFWNIDGNRTEIDRCCQRGGFLLFAGCLGACSFFFFFSRLHLECAPRCCDPERFFLKGVGTGVRGARGFVLILDSLVPAFGSAPNKGYACLPM